MTEKRYIAVCPSFVHTIHYPTKAMILIISVISEKLQHVAYHCYCTYYR
jgi:hypothetical protein